MTEDIYLEASEKAEAYKDAGRKVSVSRMLRILDVSRSGYNAWLHRLPSNSTVRREKVKEQIQKIYDESHQNYGEPKIAKELQKAGEDISERTVGTSICARLGSVHNG